ncbi:hypothetical protein, partial [Bacillus thuringiensis]|uniref:hypothetical protein n=1 Tax=Bacillus thuringiensis TaxID=1428 RepID=UPI000C02A35B
MNKSKYLFLVFPLVGEFSMSTISPTTSFADSYQSTNKVSSENPFQGYLVKNEIPTPLPEEQNTVSVNQEQIPVPQLSANPYESIPKHGTTVSKLGKIGDVLYFNDGTYMERRVLLQS